MQYDSVRLMRLILVDHAKVLNCKRFKFPFIGYHTIVASIYGSITHLLTRLGHECRPARSEMHYITRSCLVLGSKGRHGTFHGIYRPI